MSRFVKRTPQAVYSNARVRKKISGLTKNIEIKIRKDMMNVFDEAVKELQKKSPRDTTTKEDREQAIKNGEVVPFEKHGERSADAYRSKVVSSKSRKTITGLIINDYAYVVYLDKGLMDKTGLLKGKRIKERTHTGRYSLASPRGGFINRTVKRILKKNGYNIDKSRFEPKRIDL